MRVHHVLAGPYEGLAKDELPGQLLHVRPRTCCAPRPATSRAGSTSIHSHYWLSGQVGALLRDRWSVPLAHTMHTMAKVKNALLAEGDNPEPAARVLGEEQVVDAADMLIANTDLEASQLIDLYDAWPGPRRGRPPRRRPRRVPADAAASPPARGSASRPTRSCRCSSAGSSRSRPPTCCSAPSPCCSSATPTCARGSSSRSSAGRPGSGLEHPEALATLAPSLGIADVVRFVPPVSRDELVDWYAAATLVCVPSYNESFGLVAMEASAVGTPVVAAAVGGLTTVVRDGVTGLLVDGHDPADYARAIERLAGGPGVP